MKRLLYIPSLDDVKSILTYGIDIRIDIKSTIKYLVVASDSDVGPINDPQSNEVNIDALNELELEFCSYVENLLDELDYIYDIAEQSDSLTGYSIYYENVTKRYKFKDINFPIRIKLTDHLFDKSREKEQESYSRNRLSKEFDVPYEYTGFVVQSIASYRDGKVERRYNSYSEIRVDFKKKMYALEEYFRSLALSEINRNTIPFNVAKYKKYALAEDTGNKLRNVTIFDSFDDFIWYGIRHDIFNYDNEIYDILRFNCTEVYEYEYNTFDSDIVFKGVQGEWTAYVLD